MCGIAGIAATQPRAAINDSGLGAMLGLLEHRGPDGVGIWRDEYCALGHRRLAVIDLHTGRQPQSNERGNIHAVVNGEIYNFLDLREQLLSAGHRFSTTGDSETAIHLYEDHGDRFVEQLSGMFAVAVWDATRRRLVLARDRLGVKPLYWHFDGERLVFASELKAVLAAGGDQAIDATSLIDYLTFGFIPSPKTIFKGIHKLPAGHMLAFEDGRVSIRAYWDLQYRGVLDADVESVGESLWEVLRSATRLRMIADVPIGAFLSGGVDSSAVVACMAEQMRSPVRTLTCGFDDAAHDESPYARELAATLGCDHHTEQIRPSAAEVIDTLAWHFDEPFADSSAIPMYYISRAARRHAKVILSGDGGDEILAGYRRYRFDVHEHRLRRAVPAFMRRLVFGTLAGVYPRSSRLPRMLRAGSTLGNLACDDATGHGLSVATMEPSEAMDMLHPDMRGAVKDYDPLDHVRRFYKACDAPDHLSKCQYVDIKLGLADGILTKVDRASMAHGVEVRSPMLDFRFVEFAWRIAPGLRMRGGQGKYPLRVAAARRIGAAAHRAKHGFEVPMARWFRGELGEVFRRRVLDGAGPVGAWLSERALGEIFRQHAARSRDVAPTLWKALMLDAWLRQLGAGYGRNQNMVGADSPTAQVAAGV